MLTMMPQAFLAHQAYRPARDMVLPHVMTKPANDLVLPALHGVGCGLAYHTWPAFLITKWLMKIVFQTTAA